MKQKYVVSNNPDTKQISIREYTELEKGEFTFVCEEIYDHSEIEAAATKDTGALVSCLRRPNMYPKQAYAEQIAQTVQNILTDEGEPAASAEVLFDDVEEFMTEEDPLPILQADAE